VLNKYVEFYERQIRRLVEFADILLITGLRGKRRDEDELFVRHLLEKRARGEKPTIVDDLPDEVWQDQYENVIKVSD
jgi:hypothetical protein